jgi:hypothetical protein
MLLAVQKPTIEASSTEGEVVVSWKTGPSATTESYTVSCFSGDTLTCDTYSDAARGRHRLGRAREGPAALDGYEDPHPRRRCRRLCPVLHRGRGKVWICDQVRRS